MQPHDSESLKTDTISLKLLTEYLAALENMQDEPARPQQIAADENGEPVLEESSRMKWVPRIRNMENIEPEKISSAHGRLIAQGYLNFQVEDRTLGLCYRVSPEGRNALNAAGDN